MKHDGVPLQGCCAHYTLRGVNTRVRRAIEPVVFGIRATADVAPAAAVCLAHFGTFYYSEAGDAPCPTAR